MNIKEKVISSDNTAQTDNKSDGKLGRPPFSSSSVGNNPHMTSEYEGSISELSEYKGPLRNVSSDYSKLHQALAS